MKSLSYLFPARLSMTALAVAVACLCLGGGACVSNVAIPVAPGPQIYEVNGNNVNHTGTATMTNLSGQFKLPPNQQLDPPAPLGADGNVVLDPAFNYWLKSDDQVLVSWNDFSLDLPCAGSSNFQYNLCADQALLQNGASMPSQCPRDILALQRAFVIRGPSTVISVLDPDSQVAVHLWNCPGIPGSIDCSRSGSAYPGETGGLAHWIWDSGCSLPNPRFQNPAFHPIFGGTFQLWASYHEDWFRYTPSEPPDKLGTQITLPTVVAGSPQTDPVRVRLVAACGPPTPSNPNLAGCGRSDTTESHWVADPNITLSEGFGARLRVKQLSVFDSPQGTSGPIAFCWAELTGGQSPQAISDCNASAPGPCQASPMVGTADATPGTPFSKPFTVRTGPNPLNTSPDASPWVIGFSDASGGRCPNIPNRSELWVEFTLETRP